MLQLNKDFKSDDREPYDATKFGIGDILDASFVWSAKIPKFFKVTRRTASTIWAVELEYKVTRHDGYGQNGCCIPLVNKVKNPSEVYSGRISRGRLKLDGCTAKLWDGEEVDFYTD